MSFRLRCLALSTVAFCTVASFTHQAMAADTAAAYEEPKAYVGGSAYWLHPDSSRNSNEGWGSRAFLGGRLDSGLVIEGNLFGQRASRDIGSGRDSAWGVGGDFLFPFTTGGIQPFVLAGGGYTNEKINGSREGAGYADAGAGFLVPLTEGLKLRTEARYVAVFNDFGSTSGKSTLYDLDVGLGLQADIGKRKPLDADGDGVLDINDACPNTPAGVSVDTRGCPLDSDGDGVADYLDKCPNTPKGATVNAQGCPLDSDGDGVPDYLDKCPGTPAGATVDASGCPVDSDHDGVADYLDKCPNTPAGLKVDATGCVLHSAQTIVLQNVNFEFNKATLTGDSKTVLNEVAIGIKSDPKLQVEIAGHTDNKGKAPYNLKLSQARAASVKDYLVSQGVPASRLVAKGYGLTKPVASNDTETGRAQNRRVEFRVLAK